jgi:hypothetical protein
MLVAQYPADLAALPTPVLNRTHVPAPPALLAAVFPVAITVSIWLYNGTLKRNMTDPYVVGGGTLSCVAQANLVCDAAIIERGKSLCRATTANGGIIDGANVITSLSQAKVN